MKNSEARFGCGKPGSCKRMRGGVRKWTCCDGVAIRSGAGGLLRRRARSAELSAMPSQADQSPAMQPDSPFPPLTLPACMHAE